jgi:8-oxo-dGTP diphosphatase
MKHMIVPAVNVFIVKGSKILLGRRKNKSWMDGFLCAPGGHIEQGETPLKAAIRELQEELAVNITPESLTYFCIALRNSGNEEHVTFCFMLDGGKYEFKNNEPDQCSELVWAELSDLPVDIIPDFKLIIESGLKGGNKYIEFGYTD